MTKYVRWVNFKFFISKFFCLTLSNGRWQNMWGGSILNFSFQNFFVWLIQPKLSAIQKHKHDLLYCIYHKYIHYSLSLSFKISHFFSNNIKCRNPTLRELWGCHSHFRKWDLRVLRDSQKFRAWLQGSKHLALRHSLYRWKGLEV